MGEPAPRETGDLLRILELNRSLGTELSSPKLLRAILDAAVELLGAERGFILLREEDKVRCKVARSLDRETINRPGFKVSRTIADQAMAGEAQLISDARNDPRFFTAESVAELGLASVVCVPLRGREGTLGALYLDHRFRFGAFQEAGLYLLERFADQVSVAIQNAHLVEELEQKRRTVEALNAQLQEENRVQADRLRHQHATLERAEGLRFKRIQGERPHYDEIIGASPAIEGVFALLDRIIHAPFTVLIEGESGTGKELVARAIHRHSPRSKAPFLTINCGALNDELLDSELFGHEKGAFTGAVQTHAGLFERADGGVLFLDEIGDTSTRMQTKLLRVLQEGEVRRVGGSEVRKVSVRVLCATNRDLRALVDAGSFREDLYYRINVLRIDTPPLRARAGDVPLLCEQFLGEIAAATGDPPKTLRPEAIARLETYHWPGNVRQLRNVLRAAVAFTSGPEIAAEALGAEVLRPGTRGRPLTDRGGRPLEDVLYDATRGALHAALAQAGGDKVRAAKALAISRATIYRLVKQHGDNPDGAPGTGSP